MNLVAVNQNCFISGHQLEEIRIRALRTIISKLDYGLITEAELLDKDKLFENLVEWFEFDSDCSKEEVLKLILRLLQVSFEVLYYNKSSWSMSAFRFCHLCC